MLAKLRYKLTLTCTLITSSVLILMVITSLLICESQLHHRSKVTLQDNLNTVIYYLQSCSFISPIWLSQTEATNNLIIHIEQNHNPLLYKIESLTPSSRETLISLAKTHISQEPLDATKPSTADSLNSNFLAATPTPFEISTPYNEHFLVSHTHIVISGIPLEITILKNMSHDDFQIIQLRFLFILVCLLCIIILTFFSWWFSGRSIKPIEESNQKQKDFIAAASHELRAPITVIKTNASVLEKQIDVKNLAFISTISNECTRMSKLVSDLLLLANMDAKSSWILNLQDTQLDTFLLEFYDDFYITAQAHSHPITLTLPEQIVKPIQVDQQRLTQVLIALLDNALTYTPAHTPIKVTLEEAKHTYIIKVIDYGPGITDADKQCIFERFYQTDSSRHSRMHFGLGLSIAKDIILLHKGTISLQDTPTGGCTFIISLPRS